MARLPIYHFKTCAHCGKEKLCTFRIDPAAVRYFDYTKKAYFCDDCYDILLRAALADKL